MSKQAHLIQSRLSRSAITVVVALTAALSGCASRPTALYDWNGYQTQVYAHLLEDGKSSAPAEIAKLEEGLQKASGAQRALPPGYRAQLGMLYLNTGRPGDAQAMFEAERAHFPESARFMDYLIGNLKKNKS